MRGVKLIESIKLFGFKDALFFLFRWKFINPLEMFYWKVINKPYCLEHGYCCKDFKNCKGKKLYTRKEIKEELNKNLCSATLKLPDGFCMCDLDEGHEENHKGFGFEWEEGTKECDMEDYSRHLNLFKIHIKKR